MKKVISILLVLLALCACANKDNQTKISNGSDVLFSGPDNVSFTKQDLYDAMKTIDSQVVVNDILEHIALKNENVNIEDLNAQVDEIVEMYTSLGYESYIISQYGSMDAFREYYMSSLLVNELSKVYVIENYDKIVSEDSPVKMQMAVFNELADAEKCIANVNNGSTFDMAALNNNSTNTPESAVYSDSDQSLVYDVKEYLNSTDTLGLSSIITYTTSTTGADGAAVETSTYYVLNIESRNVEDFKDDYINLMATYQDADTVKNYYLETHDIAFYDQDIYKLMSSEYEVLK
ncbi:MAG: hypothetical protein J6S38_05255 [Erysipelotrichaceae bacterium]|nr:hypothetical protein [Erysipelotrichaceae bacterium]